MHMRPAELGYEFGRNERGMAHDAAGFYNGSTRRRRAPSPLPSAVASAELDKALTMVKSARGHVELLYEALVNAEGPQDLWGGFIPEFRANCRASLGAIDQQVRWLNDEVSKASIGHSQLSMPMIMRALKEFEGVQAELRAVLQLYDGLEQAGSDPIAQERAKNDYAIRLLASNPGRELGGGSHVPTRAPSPLDEERYRRVSNIAKTARGHADLLRDTVAFSSAEDLRGPLIEEFRASCLESQKAVFEHLQWADAEASKSRRRAASSSATREETLFTDLIATDQALTDALKTHDDALRGMFVARGKQRQEAADPFADPAVGADLEAGLAAARTGKGNAELLIDALKHARRQDLTDELIQEFWSNCRTSQKDIVARIPEASAAVEQSRNVASGSASTREEKVLEELLGANEAVLKALEMYDAAASGKDVSQIGGLDENVHDVSKRLPPTPEEVTSAFEQQTLADLPPLTAEDKARFTKIFYANNPKNGLLTGAQARELLLKSNLPQETLSRIWDLADVSRRGALDLGGFIIALYLIRECMSGALKPLPLSLPAALYAQAGSKPLVTHPSQGPTPGASRLNTPGPSVTPKPVPPNATGNFDASSSAPTTSHTERIFETLDPERTGHAQAYTVTSFLLKLGLPMELSGQIMNAADIGQKGYLTKQEFAVAMQLVDRKKAGEDISTMIQPTTSSTSQSSLPASPSHTQNIPSLQIRQSTLIDMDSELDPTLVPLPRTPVSPSLPSPTSPVSSPNRSRAPSTQPLQSQATGSALQTAPNPQASLQGHQRTASQQWDINPVAKARFDTFFDALDPWRKGYIEGDVAVPFFAKSKLPDNVMADIWDLADLNGDGRLTRDEFAVAMHLIRAKLKGTDLPRTLPPSLVPPSLRRPQGPPLPPRGASLRDTGAQPRPVATQATGATSHSLVAQSTGTPSIAPPPFSERAETPPPSYEDVLASDFR